MKAPAPPTPPRLSRADGLAIAALIVLAVAFFWKMAFTDLILPRGDVFTYFYPLWAYRNAAISAGRLPLWNPYLFMGAPFLANTQAGVLYPPNWPLAPLDAPTAVKVAIITHVAWATIGTHLFARRSLRLSVPAAALAAIVFALGGYFTAQAEHINQLQGLAWLPWLFLLWGEAALYQRRRFTPLLALAFAMQLLAGHSQTTFISGVGLGVWALTHTLLALISKSASLSPTPMRGSGEGGSSLPPSASASDQWRRASGGGGRSPSPLQGGGPGRGWRREGVARAWPLLSLALAAILSLGLAAAQILPTLELAGLSNRSGGLPLREAVSFSLRPQIVGRALLPAFAVEALFSEYVAYIGVAALILALLGLWARRRDAHTVALAILAALGLFFALGAYNPVYWALVRFVPGFDLFRAPARWLALYAFSMASLAATSLDALTTASPPPLRGSTRHLFPLPLARGKDGEGVAGGEGLPGLWLLPLAVIVLAAWSFLAPLAADSVPGAARPAPVDLVLWAAVLILTLALIVWMRSGSPASCRLGPSALIALVGVELFLAARALPYNDLSAPQAWSQQRPAISALLVAQADQAAPDRFLSLSDTRFDPGDLREINAIYGPYLTADALYDFIVATKQQEILAPNLPLAWGILSMDGFDGGILPTRDYTRFTSLFLPEGTAAVDGRLREYLRAVPEPVWLRMASVRWIITDKVADAWIGDVYYDLQFPASRTADQRAPIQAHPQQPFDMTAVGIVGYVTGAAGLPDGTEVASVAAYPADGSAPVMRPLRMGRDLAEGTPEDRHLALIRFDAPIRVDRVQVTIESSFPGTLTVQGLSLIDERSGAFVTTTLSEDGALRLVHSGDVKIYEDRAAPPRAALVCAPQTVANAGDAFARLAADPTMPVIVAATPPHAATTCDATAPGQAAITAYAPERVTVQVDAQGEGVYLFLADAYYPGWQAAVDGQPAPIYRANGLFRAVPVPPGQHEVVFAYKSRPLIIGAAISVLCLVGVITGIVIQRRR
jgi:hypothetical protein